MKQADAEYPTIWVGVDKSIGSDVVVKADGILLGPADWLVNHIGSGIIESERANSTDEPEWLRKFREDAARRRTSA